MGYIGLPTACTFASHGLRVTGVDVNPRILDVLRNGEVHIEEPGLKSVVQEAFRSGHLRVGSAPVPADAFIIAVPTPINADKTADLSFVVSAAESIVPHMRPGNLIVLESTSPPRTTVDIVRPILQRSGLRAGQDFYLAYSPERVLPGQILHELVENARVIGGIDTASAEAGKELYSVFVRGEVVLTDATTAEMVKLMENTYRDVNIALANEFARLAEHFGVDVWQAISAANRHPRVKILKPGPGVGGHCISVDPWFLVEAAPELAGLVAKARSVNDEQPRYVVDLLRRELGSLAQRRIAVLGLTYKPDVDDVRESPAIEVVQLLAQEGAQLTAFDPLAPQVALSAERVDSLERAVSRAEVVLLLVPHQALREIDPAQLASLTPARVAFDCHSVWDRTTWARAGFRVRTLGAPSAA
ncbi:MAG: UDP-N-acetyl-D-mannosamine dehydrogenase [Chloroflexi bacterium RBG_16_64_43]|nr:MAG: UDP-N-acetyl-D-mannosamine dehydrogenase [Chloroflexi bacterium RBG_16_64_43]